MAALSMELKQIVQLPCLPENNFFPDLKSAPRTDLIYFCSPNNPTGAAATFKQLEELVDFAKKNGSIILYDAAYAPFIRGEGKPSSIFEISGSEKVSIEFIHSQNLPASTGVRLGWTVVPSALKYDDGRSIKTDWNRLVCTLFNGASSISQEGGFLYYLKREIRRLLT